VRDAALDKKAEDVLILPLNGRTIVADTFVIATGRSKIQTRSIADSISEKAREAGQPPCRSYPAPTPYTLWEVRGPPSPKVREVPVGLAW